MNAAEAFAALDEAIAAAGPGDRAGLVVQLAGRLASLGAGMAGPAEAPGGEERLLSVEEAAGRLGMSRAWLYRNAAELPCTVRLGRRLLFSERGLEGVVARRRA